MERSRRVNRIGRIISGAVLFAVVPFALPAETTWYGEYAATATAAVPGDDEYDSAINPWNAVLGLSDVTLSHVAVVKLTGGDETAGFEVWTSLGSTTGIPSEADRLYTLDLRRANINWYMGDNVRLKLGRQSMLTGYGYGWNPIDFANPPKDPTDPETELSGVDALLIHLFPYGMVNAKLYGLFGDADGVDYDQVEAGGEITASFPGVEVKATGLYDLDDTVSDGRTSAVGAAALVDILGIGVYGEGAVHDGSRVDATETDPIWLALGGIEYTFLSELTLVAEYFYNGEGFDPDEREAYLASLQQGASDLATALKSATTESDLATAYETFGALLTRYRPGYFSRHYGLINLFYPFYSVGVDVNFTALASLDSGALMVAPMVTWYTTGALTLEATYSGLFSLQDDASDEAALSPVNHAVVFTGTYSF